MNDEMKAARETAWAAEKALWEAAKVAKAAWAARDAAWDAAKAAKAAVDAAARKKS